MKASFNVISNNRDNIHGKLMTFISENTHKACDIRMEINESDVLVQWLSSLQQRIHF